MYIPFLMSMRKRSKKVVRQLHCRRLYVYNITGFAQLPTNANIANMGVISAKGWPLLTHAIEMFVWLSQQLCACFSNHKIHLQNRAKFSRWSGRVALQFSGKREFVLITMIIGDNFSRHGDHSQQTSPLPGSPWWLVPVFVDLMVLICSGSEPCWKGNPLWSQNYLNQNHVHVFNDILTILFRSFLSFISSQYFVVM